MPEHDDELAERLREIQEGGFERGGDDDEGFDVEKEYRTRDVELSLDEEAAAGES